MSAALLDVMLRWLANFEFSDAETIVAINKFNLTIPFYLPMPVAPLITTLYTEKSFEQWILFDLSHACWVINMGYIFINICKSMNMRANCNIEANENPRL